MSSVSDNGLSTRRTAIVRMRLAEPSINTLLTKAMPAAYSRWNIKHVLADCTEEVLYDVVLVKVSDFKVLWRVTLYLLCFPLLRWHQISDFRVFVWRINLALIATKTPLLCFFESQSVT